MTSAVFGYRGLYDTEKTDVQEFWSELPAILQGDTVYQPAGLTAKFDPNSRYNQKTAWLKHAADQILSGKKPLMIPDACCIGIVYDSKKKDVVSKSLQGRVASTEMLINCPISEHVFFSFYTTIFEHSKVLRLSRITKSVWKTSSRKSTVKRTIHSKDVGPTGLCELCFLQQCSNRAIQPRIRTNAKRLHI